MNNWFEVKCKYTKEFTDGTLKRVTEPYLLSAMSFTEAEARIYKEVAEYIRGEFQVTAIKKVDYADIFAYEDADIWFHAKVSYVSEDSDTGKEKKFTNNYMVEAHNVKEAYERIEECLKGLMVTHQTPEVKETSIVEIFPYDPEFAADIATDSEEDETMDSPNVNVAYAHDEEE